MKKLIILSICFIISLCGCQRITQDNADIYKEVEQSVSQEGGTNKSDKAFIDKYIDI